MREPDGSIVDALRQALQDIRDLIRTEIALARAEVAAEIARLRSAVLALAMGALFAVAAFLFGLTAVAWAIVGFFDWPVWSGFAIVAGGAVPFAAALTIFGVSRLSRDPHMPRTIGTMKENMKWLQARTH